MGLGRFVGRLAGLLMMLVFWGGIAALIVLALRGSSERREHSDARDVLEERFAKGELSEEEFEQRMRVLERSSK